jgi:class 3 adenylate cyclase
MEDVLERRVRDLLGDAESEAERGAWDRVQALARAALSLDPDNDEAKRLLQATERSAEPAGEWRQLTVMFCDLVGSTPMSERLSGEAYREVLLRYQQTCDDVIARHGGRIAKFQGDGILAYFGHPTVHEDDAHRGVRAGLELTSAITPLAAEMRKTYDAEVAIRVAVHTGLVVLSDMGTPRSPEPAAIVGEAPNLAARLQDHARPNTLVISGSTNELVRGFFVVEPQGAVELRGLSRPVEVFRVVEEGSADTRMDAATRVAPFVGRVAELEELDAQWRSAADGGFSAVVVTGEPGIGKSRLADVIRRRISEHGGATLAATCSSSRTSSHLWAARRLVEYAVAVSARSDPDDALRRVQRALATDGLDADLPLFAALLGLPETASCPTPELAPAVLRERTLDAVVRWITVASARAPRLVVVDDLQWADPSTVELLRRVIAARPPGLFLLMTARSGTPLPWPDTSQTTITLGPLARSELRLLAAGLTEQAALRDDRLEEAVTRSDGVPLYFEELVIVAGQAAQPVWPASLPWQHDLPPSLIGPLLARVEAPGVDLRLIQLMAVIGQEVPAELLNRVAGLDIAELDQRLAALEAAGLIEAVVSADVGDGGGPSYRFHHRLLWELVYDMQLLPARVARHGKVADALIAEAGSLEAADGAVAGRHLEQAIRTPEAIRAYVSGARRALSDAAEAELEELLGHGLELLESVTEDETRLALELAVRQLRGLAATTKGGYLAPEAIAEHERCLEICQVLPRRPEHLPAALNVWVYYLLKGDLDAADGVLDAQLERMGEAWPGIRVEPGCRCLVSFFRGDVQRALGEVEQYVSSPHRLMQSDDEAIIIPDWPQPADPVSMALAHGAVAALVVGDWEIAEQWLTRAEARTAVYPFPYRAFGSANIAVVRSLMHRLLGDFEGASASAQDAVDIGDRHGFPFWTLAGNLATALTDARCAVPGAQDRVEALVQVWRFTGVDVWTPYFAMEHGMTLLLGGDTAAALAAFEQGVEVGERTGSLLFAAETARLIGETRLQMGDASGLASLEVAAKTAAAQGTRLFELRARTAIQHHDPSPAHAVELQAVVDAMAGGGRTDGLLAPTADLEAARAALAT